MVWPPLGLWYLATRLEALGHSCDFFDLSFAPSIPPDGAYDQMWLSATSPQMFEVRRIAAQTAAWTKTRTILGGAAPWANPTACLAVGAEGRAFDLVVSGESDHPETVERIVELAERPPDSRHFVTPTRRDLDWVAPPVRRWNLDYHSYMKDRFGRSYRMASIFTARGCPMECAFCESGRHGVIWDGMVRYEPLEQVEEQIADIARMGFTGLAYYDDIFILNRNRALKLMDLHRRYSMVMRCFLRSDILCKHGGKEYLAKMQDAGLLEIFVGVESADNRIKKNIHKGTTIEQDELVLQWCKELGVTCKMSFILGLPGESQESMEITRRWILQHRPDRVGFDRLIPFPGTPLTDKMADYDLRLEQPVPDEFFFRGRSDLSHGAFVSTSHLTREEIDAFWMKCDEEFRREGINP
jgi:radical SAM superfamily enzyme YgiQ (UPF0313 family)